MEDRRTRRTEVFNAILEDGNSARNSAEGNYIPFKEEYDRKKAK